MYNRTLRRLQCESPVWRTSRVKKANAQHASSETIAGSFPITKYVDEGQCARWQCEEYLWKNGYRWSIDEEWLALFECAACVIDRLESYTIKALKSRHEQYRND